MDEEKPQISTTMLRNADLQDSLLTVTNDLERLKALLGDSHDNLQSGFFGLVRLVPERSAAREYIASAIKALQFQDMASQLIDHASKRLRNCADRLAQETFAGDNDGDAVVEAAPRRPNPVTQSEMDTGFAELF